MGRDRHEGGVAIYDLIREVMRSDTYRTYWLPSELAEKIGYSESYTRGWLRQMPDIQRVGSRPFKFKIKP